MRPSALRASGFVFAVGLAVVPISGCGPGSGAPSDPETAVSGEGPARGAAVEETTPQGTGGVDVLNGTGRADVIRAGGGNDVVRGAGGDDELYGGGGIDELDGGPGNDLIDAQDPGSVGEAGRDEISCGPGRDEVLMDADDEEKPRDCETAGVGTS